MRLFVNYYSSGIFLIVIFLYFFIVIRYFLAEVPQIICRGLQPPRGARHINLVFCVLEKFSLACLVYTLKYYIHINITILTIITKFKFKVQPNLALKQDILSKSEKKIAVPIIFNMEPWEPL